MSNQYTFTLKATDQTAAAFNAAQKNLNSVSASAVKAQGALNFNAAKGSVQQLGFQIQDIAVQAQMGTNALTILGQQGSQILGLFGPGGAIVGAFVAIGAAVGTAFLPALFKSTSAIQELNEVSELLNDTLSATADGTDILSDKLLALAQRSEALAKVQIATSINDAEQQIKASVSGIEESIDDLINIRGITDGGVIFETLGRLGISLEEIKSIASDTSSAVDSLGPGAVLSIGTLIERVGMLSDKFEISKDQAADLAFALARFGEDQGPEGIKALQSALEELNQETGFSNQKLVKLTNTLAPFLQGAADGVDKINLLRQVLLDLGKAIDDTNQATGKGFLFEAEKYADGLGKKLALAKTELASGSLEAQKLAAAFELGLASASELPSEVSSLLQQLNQVSQDTKLTEFAEKMRQSLEIARLELEGSTLEAQKLAAAFQLGLTSADQLPDSISDLVTQLQRVNEQQKLNHEEEMDRKRQQREFEALNERSLSHLDSLKNALLTEEQYIEESHQRRLEAIQNMVLTEAQIRQEGFQNIADLQLHYSALSRQQADTELAYRQMTIQQEKMIHANAFLSNIQTFAGQSRKMAGIAKAAAIAQSVMNTYTAATQALAAPYPWPIPQVFAATAVAAGLANVAAIKSQPIAGFEGGGYIPDGPRIGGVDGRGGRYAILHPDETIFDHKKSPKLHQTGGQTSINLTLNVTSRRPDDIMAEIESIKKPMVRMLQKAINSPI